MLYQQLQHHLRSPRQIVVEPGARECDPPEDPNWPTPTTRGEVEKLIRRLPHWAQVVCAITAAEMVLPIWEEDEWVNGYGNLSKEEIEAPNRAIEITWQWLDEKASQTEVIAAADAARAVANTNAANAETNAADAAALAALAVAQTSGHTAAWATRHAAEAAQYATVREFGAVFRAEATNIEFYNEWWKLCRCRLAFILEARP